jgi:hypothetical protein
MRTTIPNDRYIPLPPIVFRYVPVHNATESLRWDSETNDKTTAANQHLEQSSRRGDFSAIKSHVDFLISEAMVGL